MYDIAIIGGGINGCGIARDAVGRGYSVFLAEKSDLAHGTSSGSTKLVHGGLRYLEHFEFRLVREALTERETLWKIAPHIIWPLRFVLPCSRALRPAWLLRLGLFIYDHIGGRKLLAGTKTLDLRAAPAGRPLRADYVKAFEYSDCWVDDARLVILNARDAADRGAMIHTRTSVTRVERERQHWRVSVRNARSGEMQLVEARLVVNASGPWIDRVIGEAIGANASRNVRLVKGSHIVVRKLFDHDRCYFFQNDDGRIVFAIPYERDFTLIGTTDRDYDGSPDDVEICNDEIAYLLAAADRYLAKPIERADIVWTYSAVRPLFDDGVGKAQEATRDYVLRLEGDAGQPKLINIFGGKITTYRRLAEAVLDRIDKEFDRNTKSWTGQAPLPGGDFPIDSFGIEVTKLTTDYPFIDGYTAHRLVRCYGTRAHEILDPATSWTDLGECFGAGLTQREVQYLQASEWAEELDDVIWRRTKLGLRLTSDEKLKLADWLRRHPAPHVACAA